MSITKLFWIIWMLKTFVDLWVGFEYFKLKKKWKNNNIGYEWLLAIGMGHGMMLFSMMIVFMFSDHYWILILPLAAVLLEGILLVADFEEKIFYNDTHFCIGLDALKKIQYGYHEIYSCSIGKNICAIGVGEYERGLRKSRESEKFINFVHEKYREIYDRESPRCTRIGKKDAFGEKLERPGDFIHHSRAMLIGIIIFVSFFGWTLSEQFLYNENVAQYREAIIIECYEPYVADEEPVYFWVPNKKYKNEKSTFKIMPMKDTGILSQKIYDAMWEDRTMYIYYRPVKGNNSDIVYDLRDAQGNVYCTFEETNAYFLEKNIGTIAALILVIFVAIGYYIFYIDTVKHPEKYSERTRERVESIVERYKI